MITLRRARVAVLALPIALAGCAGGDVVNGTGTVSGARSGGPTDFPSTSVSTGSSAEPTSSSTSPSGSSGSSGSTGASGQPIARLSTLTGNGTALRLDASFVAALSTLKLTPGLVGTARLTGSTVAFPVTGGTVTVYPAGSATPVLGTVRNADSGLSLTSGGTKIELTEFMFDFGAGAGASKTSGTVLANGAKVADAVSLFDLDTAGATTTGSGTSAGVVGVSVRMSADLAKVLNASFRTTAFTPALVIGSATLLLTGS